MRKDDDEIKDRLRDGGKGEHGGPASRVTALIEFWALVAGSKRFTLVELWRIMRVSKAARLGVKEHLSTLPKLVVCGGLTGGEVSDRVWRLNMATLRWESMRSLGTARFHHSCCTVNGALVVVGGSHDTSSFLPVSERDEKEKDRVNPATEIHSPQESNEWPKIFPPLSRGEIHGTVAVPVNETESAAGQVLLIGGEDASSLLRVVHRVDLSTGECVLHSHLHGMYAYHAASQLRDGRIVCVGAYEYEDPKDSAELWGPYGPEATWFWTPVCRMSHWRYGSRGCVMSDGRFAVLGGVCSKDGRDYRLSSFEALTLDDSNADDDHWEPMPPMRYPTRDFFACGVVAKCIIVVGGRCHKSCEVYDEELRRWFRLPHDLPGEALCAMGYAML